MAVEAAFEVEEQGSERVVKLSGDWIVDQIGPLDGKLRALAEDLGEGGRVDVSNLGRIDIAGAYLIDRTIHDSDLTVSGEHPLAKRLLETVRDAAEDEHPAPEHRGGFEYILERIGLHVAHVGEELLASLSFFGETLTVIAKLLVNPKRIRWVSVVNVMEHAGLNAMPIIMLLSFFIGLVVAYLGARILGDFGASVFTVELVSFSVMREFGVVITAVLLAGRTDSAFTAQIGAMKMRQEIDAMRTMGIDPMEALVAPRVLAMLVMTPLLTFAAICSGLFGGLLVCWGNLGVSPNMFFTRIAEVVPATHFWVGMSKAPVFAIVLAIIGCRQGLSVGGDVESLGKRVTTSVVQAIFMVILIDAMFALWYLELDL